VTRALVIAAALGCLLACGPSAAPGGTGYRAFTEHYAFTITSDPSPPYARERTTFKIVVRDKSTSEPIEGGEGILYGNTKDGAGKSWDSFSAGPAPGTYYANLNFIVANDWALALKFHKDSTQALETVDTWYQTVQPERPGSH
jgi:hypothetical protein